ncbi:hypothetical protein E2C01_077054 [Portunus trituberculatus]|uniref:Uncharacterized protein n=1 Tax=Portunus trituberculatus TaxID=210409 RepID=A0A5B7IKE0_PORTR|nr:hypothetical protein [Portunus trituberculatus]
MASLPTRDSFAHSIESSRYSFALILNLYPTHPSHYTSESHSLTHNTTANTSSFSPSSHSYSRTHTHPLIIHLTAAPFPPYHSRYKDLPHPFLAIQFNHSTTFTSSLSFFSRTHNTPIPFPSPHQHNRPVFQHTQALDKIISLEAVESRVVVRRGLA